MTTADDFPCRVAADLRRYEAQQDQPMPELDECDSEDLSHILPERVSKSLASLMLARQSALLDKNSGGYTAATAEALMNEISYLLADLKILWMEEA